MTKQLKDMVQICPNKQPIYGQIYPTDQHKPAEWYIGRPDSHFQFRFFMSDLHVREMLATLPKELQDDQAAVESLEARIREEVKAEHDKEIERLNLIIDNLSSEMHDKYFVGDDGPELEDFEGDLIDQFKGASDAALGAAPGELTEDTPVIPPDKPETEPVFRCLDTGKDFPTLEELQEHQKNLADKSTEPVKPAEPKKRPTAQERLDKRRRRT